MRSLSNGDLGESTSAFRTSKTLSRALGPLLSSSGARLSKLHTDTRFPVVLWVAHCTFQGPTWKVGVSEAGGSVDVADGVDALEVPIT